jgi:putative acetyltransferase
MTPDPFAWRPATAADVPALAALYRSAAQQLGPLVYTPVQVAAWASFPDDEAAFRAYVLGADTWIAERPSDFAPQGFCGVSFDGARRELRSLYVAPQATRRGLGGEMLRRTLLRAASAGACRFEAWATPISRPVFERHGFELAYAIEERFAGALFERYRMARG